MEFSKGKKWKVMGLSLLFTAALYALFLVTFPVYFHSDNWEVAVVTAGYYGSNFCQYLHPLLCVLIKWISAILPAADVFTLLVHLAIGAGITLTVYLGIEDFCRKPVRTIAEYLFLLNILLAELFLSEGLRIWSANYNIQTGAILFLGMVILFISMHQRRSAKWIAAATGLILFGLMLRVAVTFLVIPYFALLVMDEVLAANSGEAGKRMRRCVLPVVVLAAVLMLSRTAILSAEPFKTAEKYNRYRTVAVDYPMKGWRDLEDPVFSRADYAAATGWIFLDTEGLDADAFEKIADAGSQDEFDAADCRGIIGAMWERVISIDVYMFLMFFLSFALAVRNVVCSASGRHKLETVLAAAGSFIILYYFTCRGRAPLRVWQPVLFATDAVLIIVAMKERDARKTVSSVFSLILFILLWFGAGQVIAHARVITPQNILTARIDIDDSVYAETYAGDGIYIWPNWHAAIPDYFISIGKLPTQRVIDHNMAAGDWTYGQVYFDEYLNRLGIPNPAQALAAGENTYIMNGNKIAHEYLKEHFGEDLEMEPAGEVNGSTAYRIVRTGAGID